MSTQLAILSARSLLMLWAMGLVCVRNVLHSPGCSWTLPCSRCGLVSTVVDCAWLLARQSRGQRQGQAWNQLSA